MNSRSPFFQKKEHEFIGKCLASGVAYMPPTEKEMSSGTRTRRKQIQKKVEEAETNTALTSEMKKYESQLNSRSNHFRKNEQELIGKCFTSGVEYKPPKDGEMPSSTRKRRKVIQEKCDKAQTRPELTEERKKYESQLNSRCNRF